MCAPAEKVEKKEEKVRVCVVRVSCVDSHTLSHTHVRSHVHFKRVKVVVVAAVNVTP